MMLRERGFQLDTTENGREAVEKVAASEPGYYDLILMDIQMPGMDGHIAKPLDVNAMFDTIENALKDSKK